MYTHCQIKIHIKCYTTSSSLSSLASKDRATFCFSFFAFFFTGLFMATVSESVSAALVLRNMIFLDRSAGALFSSTIDNFNRVLLKITCPYSVFCYIMLYIMLYSVIYTEQPLYCFHTFFFLFFKSVCFFRC